MGDSENEWNNAQTERVQEKSGHLGFLHLPSHPQSRLIPDLTRSYTTGPESAPVSKLGELIPWSNTSRGVHFNSAPASDTLPTGRQVDWVTGTKWCKSQLSVYPQRSSNMLKNVENNESVTSCLT